MNISNLKTKQIKTLMLLLLFCLLSCNNKQREITKILTNDSIQYWNISGPRDKRPIYYNSCSFSVDGRCETYNVDIDDQRNIRVTDIVKDEHGISNTWKLINDSIINIRGNESKIISFSNDSIVIGDEKGAKIFTLYRVIGPFRINPESLKKRDSLLIEYKKLREKNKNADSASVKVE